MVEFNAEEYRKLVQYELKNGISEKRKEEIRKELETLSSQEVNHEIEELYNAMASHTISMPDLAYGVNEYYEVITSAYSEIEVNAKIDTVSIVGGHLEMERI